MLGSGNTGYCLIYTGGTTVNNLLEEEGGCWNMVAVVQKSIKLLPGLGESRLGGHGSITKLRVTACTPRSQQSTPVPLQGPEMRLN